MDNLESSEKLNFGIMICGGEQLKEGGEIVSRQSSRIDLHPVGQIAEALGRVALLCGRGAESA